MVLGGGLRELPITAGGLCSGFHAGAGARRAILMRLYAAAIESVGNFVFVSQRREARKGRRKYGDEQGSWDRG
jgi:hypothetical protein